MRLRQSLLGLALGLVLNAGPSGAVPPTRPLGGPAPKGSGNRHYARSRYIPAGPRRNCGWLGISPKRSRSPAHLRTLDAALLGHGR